MFFVFQPFYPSYYSFKTGIFYGNCEDEQISTSLQTHTEICVHVFFITQNQITLFSKTPKKMKTSYYQKIFQNTSVILLISLSLISCNNQQKKREEALVTQYRSISASCDRSDSKEIENVIASIENYLSEYPNSKRYNELSQYKDKLYECLDVHKIKEYSEKYRVLSGNTYIDIISAINDQQSFLDNFVTEYGMQLVGRQQQIKIFIQDVNDIKHEFESMKSFYERSFADLATFDSELQMKSYEFENSKFETIRLSWKEIARDFRNEMIQKEMNKMVLNFENYLKNDAEKFSQYNYSDYVIDDSQNTQTISIGKAYQHESYNAKVCEGVFRVFLKGAYLGWDKGTVKISVKGMVTVVSDQNRDIQGVEYRNIDYRVLEATGKLQ